jgi:Mg-chelatase subunit ChlD
MLAAGYSLGLTEPAWLAALVLLVPVVWYYRRSLVDFPPAQRLVSLVCRSLMMVLVILALAGLVLISPSREHFVVFVLDDSLSVGDGGRKAAQTFVDRALDHRGGNQAAFLSFAVAPGPLRRERGPISPCSDEDEALLGTNIEAALEAATAAIPPGFVPRLVLCSDGNQTTGDALAASLRLGIPVFTVPLPPRDDPEVQLVAIEAPPQVREGERFPVEVVVASNREGEAALHLWNGRTPVTPPGGERRKIRPGITRIPFTQTITDARLAVFQAQIDPYFEDTLRDNNSARGLVFCSGKPRVLVIDADARQIDPLVRVLEGQNFQVDVRPPAGVPTALADLQQYELVVLSNVPATALKQQQMRLLRIWVRDLGGGLLVCGGDQAFSLGGYSRSLLGDVLPVESAFQKDRDNPSLAMVLIIDKSGSMKDNEKIVIARDAARGAVELLGPADKVGVIAFSEQPEWVSPMRPASDRLTVNNRIDGIEAKGGTAIYPPLEKAFEALQDIGAQAKFKHVILLTDGKDDPVTKSAAEYLELAARMKASGITLTTVGVGPDADHQLLKDVAASGGGRYYPADDPRAVPQIFAKETAEASGDALQMRDFPPRLFKPTPVLARIDWLAAPFLRGYVLTRPKPLAEQILITDRGNPLLAWWRTGLGMSAAFTSSPRADWSEEWLGTQPEVYTRFWSQVARHIMRKNEARGIEVKVEPRGREAVVTVDAVDTQGRFLNDARVELTVVDPQEPRDTQALPQTAPGRYVGRFATRQAGDYFLQLSVQPADGSPPFVQSRGLSVGYPEELRLRPVDEGLLRSIAESSGGTFAPAPETIFADDGRLAERVTPLWPYLVGLAVALLLPDVALRRIEFARSSRRPAAAGKKTTAQMFVDKPG